MWGSGRAEAFRRDDDAVADLPLDIAFLARHGVATGVLAAVAERAFRLGVSPSREIIASGIVTETAFYRALAEELGLPFVEGRVPLRPGGGYGAILREGVAAVSQAAEPRFSFALAPEGRALRRLLAAGPRRRGDVVVMTPRAFLASLRDANGPALARHAAGLDQAGRARETARSGTSRGQKIVAGLTVLVATYFGTLAPLETFLAIAFLVCPVFLALIFLRVATLLERVPADLWRSHGWRLDDARLPVYTVAVPLYREEAVLPQLVAALSALDYPASKLDVLLLTESHDTGMAAALARTSLPPWFTVLVMPPGQPRTKPRALNLALLEAKGALITIFDAEDIPDPQQLRLAAARFLRAPPDLACLQARLQIDHANEGLLPALFALEYAGLFQVLNPGLLRCGLPIMLGGTSNHFRTAAVRSVGGWDAWNVTEDADLGLRLVRAGFHIADLPSRTREEAPLTVRAWLKQRSRWIKGYIQTLVTHLRRPGRLLRETGLIAGLTFVTLLFGTVATALGYPIFVVGMAYAYGYSALSTPSGFAGGLVATLAVSVWLFGALATLGVPALGALRRRAPHLLLLVPLLPAYFALTSVAAWLALYEYLTDRHGWNKTMHGSARRPGMLTDGATTRPPLPPADARY